MIKNMKKLLSEKVSLNKIVLFLVSLVVLGTGTAFAAFETSKDTVTVSLNGKEEKLRTHAGTVNELLQELDIDIKQEDEVSPSGDTKIKDNLNVVYEASKPVQLTVNDEKRTIRTTAKTVEEFIKEQRIELTEHDKMNASLHTKISDNLKLNIDKAIQITLNVGDKEQQVWSTSTTVADFLKEQKVQVNELDKVEPQIHQTLSANDVVIVTRVEKVTDVVEEPVAFSVVTKNDGNISKGKQEVIEPGAEGTVAKHFEVIMENGKEVSRKLIKEETKKESQDRVVAIGSKADPKPVSNKAETVSRSNDSVAKEFYVTSTAYTAYCNGCSGKTATGVNLRENPNAKVIAVDPSIIPLGSKVYVEGYGYAVASDTGGAIKGNKIDVFFSDKGAAYRWGRKQVKIKVLN
ncbi:ubiquitin-like domain-containing protein [Metabacillus idriensis]|uniref:ubiquitin-like domain-containing protein n=1 Tax=Metabacillus idriensis TaxID=324768 RepID=UPI0029664890|nr:ubiquitin-like domain-containing protein [Metabacillus idriensis]